MKTRTAMKAAYNAHWRGLPALCRAINGGNAAEIQAEIIAHYAHLREIYQIANEIKAKSNGTTPTTQRN